MDKNTIGIKLKRLREQTVYTIEEVALMCEITFYELKDYKLYTTWHSHFTSTCLCTTFCCGILW